MHSYKDWSNGNIFLNLYNLWSCSVKLWYAKKVPLVVWIRYNTWYSHIIEILLWENVATEVVRRKYVYGNQTWVEKNLYWYVMHVRHLKKFEIFEEK